MEIQWWARTERPCHCRGRTCAPVATDNSFACVTGALYTQRNTHVHQQIDYKQAHNFLELMYTHGCDMTEWHPTNKNNAAITWIIIIIKIGSTGPSGKTKLLINLFRNQTSTCATENWRKHNSGKQPTVDCTLEPIQRSGVKHSVGKVIPY